MSAGSAIGKFVANTAAYAVHGAVVSVNATGRFGAEVVSSASEQYTIKSAELAARRDAAVQVVPAQRQRKLKLKAEAV